MRRCRWGRRLMTLRGAIVDSHLPERGWGGRGAGWGAGGENLDVRRCGGGGEKEGEVGQGGVEI